MRLLLLALFIFLLAKVDRIFFKANHSFCLHFIDAPLKDLSWKTEAPFPASLLDQPFAYLDKGAQTYVFESQDQKYVLKFNRIPSRLRRFHFGSIFTPRKTSKEKLSGQKKLSRAYQSYFLAYQYLQPESGVVYIHLHPTTELQKKIHLIDRTGNHYHVSIDKLGFVLQKKGNPFIPLIQRALKRGQMETAQRMIDSLFSVIQSRCLKGITDRDSMHYDNYGWLEGSAVHLDIGRFAEKDEVKTPLGMRQEIVRVTSPLAENLEKNSPELFDYYQKKIEKL